MSLRLWTAILAALQILTAGTVLTEVVGVKWAALAALLIGAAQAGTAVYMRGVPADSGKDVVPPT